MSLTHRPIPLRAKREKKFFDPPNFSESGGQKILLLALLAKITFDMPIVLIRYRLCMSGSPLEAEGIAYISLILEK